MKIWQHLGHALPWPTLRLWISRTFFRVVLFSTVFFHYNFYFLRFFHFFFIFHYVSFIFVDLFIFFYFSNIFFIFPHFSSFTFIWYFIFKFSYILLFLKNFFCFYIFLNNYYSLHIQNFLFHHLSKYPLPSLWKTLLGTFWACLLFHHQSALQWLFGLNHFLHFVVRLWVIKIWINN